MVWRDLRRTLNDQTTKGCGISLGGGGYNKLEATN
jgi:hypothetical protein